MKWSVGKNIGHLAIAIILLLMLYTTFRLFEVSMLSGPAYPPWRYKRALDDDLQRDGEIVAISRRRLNKETDEATSPAPSTLRLARPDHHGPTSTLSMTYSSLSPMKDDPASDLNAYQEKVDGLSVDELRKWVHEANRVQVVRNVEHLPTPRHDELIVLLVQVKEILNSL